MADATIRGKLGSYNAGGATMVVSVPTDGTAPVVGDWMIVIVVDTGAAGTTIAAPTPPSGSGWVTLLARVVTGTRYITVFGKRRVSGETTYTFTESAGSAINAAIIYGPGGDTNVANWYKGAFAKVASSSTSLALAAPATRTVNTLQIALWGVGISSTTETDAQNTVSGTGWVKQLFSMVAASGQSTNKEFIASLAQTANTAGTAPTYTRPTATGNFGGIIIGIPTVPNPPVPDFSISQTGLSVTVNDTSVESSDSYINGGTWSWGDGTTTSNVTPATHVYSASGTYTITNTVTQDNGGSAAISKNVTVTAPTKLNGQWWDGTSLKNVTLGWWDGSAVRELAKAVRIWPGRKGRQKFSGSTPFVIAHRAGSRNFMEHTLRGATQSAIKNVSAIELSVASTSDGVLFCLHDPDLNRTTPSLGATSVLASSQTWAQVSALQQTAPVGNDATYGAGPYPYYKLSDFLDAYASSHTIFIDPKVLTTSQRAQLYAQLMSYSDPINTFVIKYFHTGTAVAAEARSFGFKSWGYGYQGDMDGTNSPQMTATASSWDYVGMEYAATDAVWAATVAIGKPIIGHIVPDWLSAQKCLTRGAVGVMASGVNEVMAGSTSGILTSDAFSTTGPLSTATWTQSLGTGGSATVTAAGNMALTNDTAGYHQAGFVSKLMAPRGDTEMSGTLKFADLNQAILNLLVRVVSPIATYFPIGYYLSITPADAAGSNVKFRVGSVNGYDYEGNTVTSSTLTINPAIKYAFRVRADGNLLRAKIWDSAGAEPGAWQWVSKIGKDDYLATGYAGVQLVSGSANNPVVNFGPLTITDGRQTGSYEHAPVLGSLDTFNGRTLTTTYVEKFDRDCALGDFKKIYPEIAYYDTIRDGFPDTSGYGDWDVTSTLSVSDGLLDVWYHSVGGRSKVACILPDSYKPHLYGRWKMRYRCQQDLPGYKFVGLMWPMTNVWNDGEIDWPEGDLAYNVRPASAVPGSFQSDPDGSNGRMTFLPPTEMFGLQDVKEFHTFTMDWTPTVISFLMDDVVVGTVTGTANIPQTAMRLTLQAETWIGAGAPPAGTSGHLKIDWIATMD